MSVCPFCQHRNPEDAKSCEACGVVFDSLEDSLERGERYEDRERQLLDEEAARREKEAARREKEAARREKEAAKKAFVRPIGAWVSLSVFTILFCLTAARSSLFGDSVPLQLLSTFPGLIALCCVVNINSCKTHKRQTENEQKATFFCFIGIVLGIILLVAAAV